jgi:Arc/MetJ-type ribon-helix-helix transcriptional regulator
MAHRTTVVIPDEDLEALGRASRSEGLSQSELIRKGIRLVTAPYRDRPTPKVGWLRLDEADRAFLLRDEFGDVDE